MAESHDTHTSRAAKANISDDAWNEAVGEWMANSMANSAMSQSTGAWNHLVAELPKLRKLLEDKV